MRHFEMYKLVAGWTVVAVVVLQTFTSSTASAEDNPFLVVRSGSFASGSIRDCALNGDGSLLAVAGDKEVRVWDVNNKTLLGRLRGFQLAPYLKLGRTNAVRFSPDSKYLYVGVSDNTFAGSIRKYALRDLSKIEELLPGHIGCADRLAFSPDGKWIASYG